MVFELVDIIGNKRNDLSFHLQIQHGVTEREVEQLALPHLLTSQRLAILAWLFVGDAGIHNGCIHRSAAFHDDLSVLHLWQRTNAFQSATRHIDKHLEVLFTFLQRTLCFQHGILETHLL